MHRGTDTRFKTRLLLSLLATLALVNPLAAQQSEKEEGAPFRSAFQFSGLGSEWWAANYDHPAKWFRTSWRKSALQIDPAGLALTLERVPDDLRVSAEEFAADDRTLHQKGKTAKDYFSAQLQRRKWYGYGRYEVIMRPASGSGLISTFYLYTGPHFGHSHEEIDLKFLGKDTTKLQLDRVRDGDGLEGSPAIELGFDAAAAPRLYAFEWTETALVWFVGDTEVYRLSGSEQVPRPPMKLYVDLWSGGERHANWLGTAVEDVHAEALVQCASYVPLAQPATGQALPQCSDLLRE